MFSTRKFKGDEQTNTKFRVELLTISYLGVPTSRRPVYKGYTRKSGRYVHTVYTRDTSSVHTCNDVNGVR